MGPKPEGPHAASDRSVGVSDPVGDDMHIELVDARQYHSSDARESQSQEPSVLRDALAGR